jgi:hypothetical protein
MIAALAYLALSAAAPAETAAVETPSQEWVQMPADVNGREIVPDDELSKNRAGFQWSGVEISLGAEMRTYINGQLALQTNVSWTPEGVQTTQYVSGALTPADAAHLQSGILSGSGITMRVGDQSVFLANQGQTVLMQRTENGLQNVLVNRASNIEIKQQVDAVVGLENFGQFQRSILSQRIGGAISDMISQAPGN